MKISDLDELVHEAPERALVEGRALLKAVEPEKIPRVLACCGTAYRLQERFSRAYAVLEEAQRWASELDHSLRGDLLQRLGYVQSAQQNFSLAYQTCTAAQNEYILAGDRTGVGKTLVDIGLVHFHTGRLRLAETCNSRALELLPPHEERNRYAAYVNLAHCHEDDLAKSLAYLDQAGGLNVPRRLQPKKEWFKAKLYAKHGEEAAVETFVKVIDLYLEVGLLFDASLGVLDGVLFSDALYNDRFMERVGLLALELPSESKASAAIAQVWIASQRGFVKTSLIEVAKTVIQREKIRWLRGNL